MVAEVARIPADGVRKRGDRNNNPGNIDRIEGVRWQGQADDQSGDDRFVIFTDPKWGIRAICRTLVTYQDKRLAADGSKIDTVREIVERWAPATENNTGAYYQHVASLLQVGIDDAVDVYRWDTMRHLVCAIIEHELGYQPYDDVTIDSGLIAAGIQAPSVVVNKGSAKVAKAVATVASAAVTASGFVLTVAPSVYEAVPLAKDGYQQAKQALSPLGEFLGFVPMIGGAIVFIAILVIHVKGRKAKELIK
jgi:hypothetical protein